MKSLPVFLLLFAASAVANKVSDSSVDALFADWQAGTPGAIVGVIHQGDMVYAKGHGMANLEYDIPIDADSVFRIGSTSKQFTAACVVLLAEQGALSLDDSLHSFFPDFPDYAKNITVRQLIHHTSGIRDYLTLSYLKGLTDEDYYEDKDIMQWLISQQELNFEPGTEHLYSNSGYWLLGQIVNKAAGMNMAAYAEKNLFGPLGMGHTHFHNNHKKIVKNRASGYVPMTSGGYEISMTTLNMIGDGGIFTSLNDIRKWDAAFYDRSVLSESFWNTMTTVGVLNNGESIDYAGGLLIGEHQGHKLISHGGAFVGFRAELLRFPDQQLSVVVFANRGDARPTPKALQVAELYLPKQPAKASPEEPSKPAQSNSGPAASLDQLTGSFEIQPGVQLEVTQVGEVLHVKQTWNGIEYDLQQSKQGGNVYQIGEDDSITFTFTDFADQQAQAIDLLQAGNPSTWQRKAETDVSAVVLTDFVGEYYSAELDVVYQLKMDGDQLMVQVLNNEPAELNAMDTDQLGYQGSIWDFQRTDGEVTGFKLQAGRVQNLVFVKQ
jgi:CubicO group peptidase (beta-lactamase class C family)